MSAIATSILELFKIGPGPSSSHTIGPMAAARSYLDRAEAFPPELVERAARVRVRLLGSLAATGEGHGSIRAVLAGLLGHAPDGCPPDILSRLAEDAGPYEIQLAGRRLPLRREDVVLDLQAAALPHPNTLVFELLDEKGGVLREDRCASTGGGFIAWVGERPRAMGAPTHPYATMDEFRQAMRDTGLSLPELLLANEEAVSGLSIPEIETRLDELLAAMRDAVRRGVETEGRLPGPVGLWRKAPDLARRAQTLAHSPDRLLAALSAAAFAAAEENAAGHLIVTAPTAGSAGVLPAVAHVLRKYKKLEPEALRQGLLAAALVGFLARHNASVSGAEVGCQGEVGVASAMAAAMIAQARDFDAGVVESAAETALEHHLGMTCDPVRGYVQIPCIERNAMGAVKAYTAFLIASAVASDRHKVGLDQAMRAMYQTGRDMAAKYKETALGGLALAVRC